MPGCATVFRPMSPPTAVASLLALNLLLAACAGLEGPTPTPERVIQGSELPIAGGCADTLLYATSQDAMVAVVVDWPGAASAAHAAGDFVEFSENVTLPADEVRVRLQVGSHLGDGFCTDVIVEGRPNISAEAEASAGVAEITVVPEAAADPIFPLGRATLELTDVVFVIDLGNGPEEWRLDRLELRNIQVGWLAG
ncbi:MAG TPA: hypothetical protein VNW68_01320 [Candidatus Limnocylindria bacterium]|nr:hypothetical protein [Candidatus Limnocylindria bacterium]